MEFSSALYFALLMAWTTHKILLDDSYHSWRKHLSHWNKTYTNFNNCIKYLILVILGMKRCSITGAEIWNLQVNLHEQIQYSIVFKSGTIYLVDLEIHAFIDA